MNSIELAEAVEVRTFRSHLSGDPRGRLEVRFRPLAPGDQVGLGEFLEVNAADGACLRSPGNLGISAWELARHFFKVDGFNEYVLIGTSQAGETERIVALGRYVLDPDTEMADMSFLVDREKRKMGIASHLVHRISDLISARALPGMSAIVPETNLDMLHILGEILAPADDSFTDSGQTTLRWFFSATA